MNVWTQTGYALKQQLLTCLFQSCLRLQEEIQLLVDVRVHLKNSRETPFTRFQKPETASSDNQIV